MAEPIPTLPAVEEPVAMDETSDASTPDPKPAPAPPRAKDAVATFGGGCFWCTEAVFLRLKGVTAVESGYSGGFVKDPTYEAVCSGETGHAEVCRITFNPDLVSFKELLKVFWMTHDPTTLNQQGADRGTQYRSVVFYHDKAQKELAEKYKQELDKTGAFPGPIVTEISPLKDYYKAEEYHQNYFERNPFQGYCQAVVRPKVEKFEKVFKDNLKTKP
jgi:peptide-methionine (S)-S-oxide reductase